MVFPVDNVGAPFCNEIGHLGLEIRKIFACGAQKYRLAALAGEIADPGIAGKRPLGVVHHSAGCTHRGGVLIEAM